MLLKANLLTGMFLHSTVGQPVYNDDLEEEYEFVFVDHRPTRDGDRNVRDFDWDDGDFRLKVDISYFNGNLNIKDFIDWLVDIDKIL